MTLSGSIGSKAIQTLRQCVFTVIYMLIASAVYLGVFGGSMAAGVSWAQMLKYCATTALLLAAMRMHRMAWLMLWPLLCIAGSLTRYLGDSYGIALNRDVVLVAFEASIHDISAFKPLEALGCLALGIIFSALVHRCTRHIGYSVPQALLCLMAGMSMLLYLGKGTGQLPPYTMFYSVYEYTLYAGDLNKQMRARAPIEEQAGTYHRTEPLAVVLVIGESARADHWSANGYGRPTTPLMQQQANVVNFSHARSCAVMTHISVPCMLTRSSPENLNAMYHERSVISVFRALGFNTAWYGAQGIFSLSTAVAAISAEAEQRTILHAVYGGAPLYDEQLLAHLDHSLADTTKDLFVVLHLNGSHINYTDRYPPAFRRFKERCIRGKAAPAGVQLQDMGRNTTSADGYRPVGTCGNKLDMLVNSYDNSIVYTDWVLSEVMARLGGRNALMLYTSDHGESLGENGRYMHPHPEEESNWHVPMMLWASQRFVENRKASWSSVRARAADAIGHQHVFHTLLGCAGARSALIDPYLNLCSVH